MALVPVDFLSQVNRFYPDLTPLTNPIKEQVVKGMGEVKNILENNIIPEDIKNQKLNEGLIKNSVFNDKLLHPIIPTNLHSTDEQDSMLPTPKILHDVDIIGDIPKSYQLSAKRILEEIKKHPDIIKWDPTSYEVKIRGKNLKGSNLGNLIGDIVRSRKNPSTDSSQSRVFLKALADLKLPNYLIKNKNYLKKFRVLKGLKPHDELDNSERLETSGYEFSSPSRSIKGKRKRRKKDDVEWFSSTPIKGIQRNISSPFTK